MNNQLLKTCFFLASLLLQTGQLLLAGGKNSALSFEVSMEQPASHVYHVVFICTGMQKDTVTCKMPNWMPGYYQLLNYADHVTGFSVAGPGGTRVDWKKTAANAWTVYKGKLDTLVISYDVKADRSFVAENYLDAERGFIAPTGLFLYPDGLLDHGVTVKINLFAQWTSIATGLQPVKNTSNVFWAENYDVLYDSPILMGRLASFPAFTVKHIPHYFVAYQPDDFDRAAFMNDLKKIVETAFSIMGDIPYNHYTFLGTGPGGGGIEHLNSAAVAFTGKELNDARQKIRTYNFLAHEYFHLYNVKRIRPVELGPFDYDKGNRTRMLWLSEGITVYYEYIILKRAGFTSMDELLKTFQQSIKAYEDKPGRHFQTPAEASYTTWEDGPFGRTGDDVNKTISPYDKGPALGILLDFKLRHETGNKKSLDDLMRLLYHKYYQQLNRGFTENEFSEEAERMAGASLKDFFDYIYTLKTVDYPAYLGYAGLSIDTTARLLPGAWLGIAVREKNDTLWIANTEWGSPAWEAGLRNRQAIVSVDGVKLTAQAFTERMARAKPGDTISILANTSVGKQEKQIVLSQKKEASYNIVPINNPDHLQQAIFKHWLGEQ